MQRLILCGGGHVSLEVALIAQRLDFEIIVIDDREEFANGERFPMAAQVLAKPFLPALDEIGSRTNDYYAILTRGHAFDRECLSHVLKGNYAYVGMIGSKLKVASVMVALEAEGFTPKTLAGVHTPIGLSIGAQTPAEIAVSILAEIIQERSLIGPDPVPPPKESGVLCTIAKKSGSAPRGEGAWMLIRPDGSFEGTIGGGSVEFQAKEDALALWASGQTAMRKTYDLSQNAADLGMVCGGKIEVLFTARRL